MSNKIDKAIQTLKELSDAERLEVVDAFYQECIGRNGEIVFYTGMVFDDILESGFSATRKMT